ncbi:MAG: alpha/beta hydrolase [Anaerolineales bacterium]|nr:alpha/beta hydrolase [Anaerolineales bacterium]
MLHGFPEFWYGWRKQIPALAKAGYRGIVPDQRGYNLSGQPAGIRSYRLPELAADMTGLLDQLGHEKVCLAGHDWGAAAAWSLAIWRLERFHKLAILNVPHPRVMSRFLSHSLDQMRRSWGIGFFQIPWLPKRLLEGSRYANLTRLLAASGKAGSFTKADLAEYKKSWSHGLAGMLNWYRALVRHPAVYPGDARVRIPTLLIWGMQDAALSYQMAHPSLDYCDHGTLVFFGQATHWVQHDEARTVNQLLVDFFKPTVEKGFSSL